jgi:hypothetical protein
MEEIFREYKFEVTSFVFGKGSPARSQLHKVLATFVHDHEHSKTLLIVYYAGHGKAMEFEDQSSYYMVAG